METQKLRLDVSGKFHLNEADEINDEEQNGLFITAQDTLSINSWDLLLKKETPINKYKRTQKEILKSIFEE